MIVIIFKLVPLLCVSISAAHGFGMLGNRFTEQPLSNTSSSEFTEELWVDQPVDHFNATDDRTWRMRYLENKRYWKPNGPIYLNVGGRRAQRGDYYFIRDIARDTKGIIISSEHRFYGKSFPFKNFTKADLKYQGAKQALADLVTLLKAIKTKPEYKTSKVIAIGGSYAGNLAAWMRLLYPNSVDAALASSAPVLAKVEFRESFDKVMEDYKKYGTPECADKVLKTFSRYGELLASDEGIKQLKQEENICDYCDMKETLNQQKFLYLKQKDLLRTAEFGTTQSIKDVCKNMSINLYTSQSNEKDDLLPFWDDNLYCVDYRFQTMFDYLEMVIDELVWAYQTCTEFGYFSLPSDDIVSRKLSIVFYTNICMKLFGPDFDEERVKQGVDATNKLFGGLKPNVTRVVFVNGGLDIWGTLGITKDLSRDAPARLIPGTCTVKDLLKPTSDDPKELKETQNFVKQMLKKWTGLTSN